MYRFITFDEKSTRAEHWRYDKFACMQSFFESFNENIHQVTLLLTKLCTHIVEELDSNSIILASQPNMGFYIARFVMLQYLTLTFPCLTLVSWKFLIKKIQQQTTILLELMSTLSILSCHLYGYIFYFCPISSMVFGKKHYHCWYHGVWSERYSSWNKEDR